MTRCGSLLRVVAAVVLLCMTAYGQAQEPKSGRLKIAVSPAQAYTFLDGQALGHSNQNLKLNEGNHHVMIANYGYKFFEQDVSITPGQTTSLNVSLDAMGGEVAGPKGSIQLELGSLFLTKAGTYAVLLTGTNPKYFVGHIDEFNNYIINKQQLFVPPGSYNVTVRHLDRDVWSGTVNVAADERVIVDISNGKQKVKHWPSDAELAKAMPRFKAGTASASVVIAPVSSTMAANPARIKCGQDSLLTWNSAETIDADISHMSPVPTSGERTVSPTQTTTYDLTAMGPGGTTHSQATVDVDTAVTANMTASPSEVHYRRIGDKVIQQDPTTLKWSAVDANSSEISSIGSVSTSGSQTVMPTPRQTTEGPIDETVDYTLTAGNPCGGTGTTTASVRIVGSIEPIPSVVLQSVFYPTAYPPKPHPDDGLVKSQKDELSSLAASFTKYLEYDPDAKITLAANTDPRGNHPYNLALSMRRAMLVKDYLVSQGIAAERIDYLAQGKKYPLTKSQVDKLISANPEPTPKQWVRNMSTTHLAYERRVDIVLDPTKQESERYFPNAASDAHVIWQRPMPPLKVVKDHE